MSKLVKKLEELEAKSDKAAEVAYVRKEKAVDAAAHERLTQLYGTGKSIGGDDGVRRKRSWKCVECGFENFTSRNACGECLAQNPDAVQRRLVDIKQPARCRDSEVRIATINRRCYRVFRGEAPSKKRGALTRGDLREEARATISKCDVGGGYNYDSEDADEPACGEEGGSGAEAADGQIAFDKQNQVYFVRLPIPPRYYKFLIGAKGQTLQETQRLTGATVLIPKGDDVGEGGAAGAAAAAQYVVIKGPTESAVAAAQIRTDSIVMQSKHKVDYTHFLSIPLGTIPSIRHALETLLHDMKAACIDEGANIDESLFQTPQRLHLTLLMLRLHTEEELSRCKAIMIDLEEKLGTLFSHNDLVTLKGVNYMNDDPSEVHVVYLELEKDDVYSRLAKVIQIINDAFIDAGLALDKDVAHNEKLHATIVNSKWRESTAAGGPRLAFDATNILSLFRNVCLGSHRLRHLELNVLGGGRRSGEGEGYYQCEFAINFP